MIEARVTIRARTATRQISLTDYLDPAAEEAAHEAEYAWIKRLRSLSIDGDTGAWHHGVRVWRAEIENETFEDRTRTNAASADKTHLEYQLEVLDFLPPRDPRAPQPTQSTVRWKGTHAPLGKRTLVLRHARHHDLTPGRVSGVEVYAFLSAAR